MPNTSELEQAHGDPDGRGPFSWNDAETDARMRTLMREPAAPRGAIHGGWRWGLTVAGLAVVYFVTGRVGLMLDAVSGFAAVVWPPAGIAVAGMLIFGLRSWPGVALGAFFVNASIGAPALTALAMAFGNTLEAVTGACILRRLGGFRCSFERLRDVFHFTLYAALLSPLVAATVGTVSLMRAGILSSGSFMATWVTWWIGDVLGVLIVAPMLLTLATRRSVRLQTAGPVETALSVLSLAIVAATVFGDLFGPIDKSSIAYVVFPPLIWISLRFGPRGAAVSIFLLAAAAVWGIMRGSSPFTGVTLTEQLTSLQMFMGVVALTNLVLAAMVAERRRSELRAREHETALRRAHDELERRVQERTRALSRANDVLQQEVAERRRAEQALQAAHSDLDRRVRERTAELSRINAQLKSALEERREAEEELRRAHDELEHRVQERTASLQQASESVKRELADRAHMERQLTRTNELLVKNQTELLETLVKFKRANEELKATQQQLFQAAKLESVGRMAAGVAHEVKNPLATLLIGIEHLCEHVPVSDGNIVLLLQDMQRAVRKADSVIKGLLNFSAPEKLELASEDVNAVVEQALTLMKHEFVKRHVTLIRELAPDAPRARIDRSKIEQVLVNLLMNASQAMGEGGQVTVRTRLTRMRHAGSRRGRRADNLTVPEGQVVAIEVEDSGPGIADEALGKIFDPFFTTKPTGQGTGLGLTVSKKIIDLHGGSIELKNRPEGGIRATLLFSADRTERSDVQWTGNGSSSSMTK